MARKLTKNPRKAAPALVTVNSVANRSGRDRRTIERRIALAGVVPVKVVGKTRLYQRSDVERLLVDEVSIPGSDAQAAACERVRNIILKNDKLEFELAGLRASFIPVADVSKWMGEVIARAEAVLLTGPGTLAPQVVSETIPGAERLIRDWLHDALTQLHKQPATTLAAA